MASPVTVEDHSNTKTDEGTTTFHKKRSRRVSFAEITSIHIFDRDEPFESPPDPNPPSSPNEDDSGSRKFFPDEEEDNEDELGPRSPCLRVVVSPSSGGSTIGSAISNDGLNGVRDLNREAREAQVLYIQLSLVIIFSRLQVRFVLISLLEVRHSSSEFDVTGRQRELRAKASIPFFLAEQGLPQVVEGEDTNGLVQSWISEAYADRLHVEVKAFSQSLEFFKTAIVVGGTNISDIWYSRKQVTRIS